jgi:hypothetical protein
MENKQEEGLNEIQKEIQKEKINTKINSIKNLFEKNKDKDSENLTSLSAESKPLQIPPFIGEKVKHRISIYTPQLKQCKN